MQILFYKILFMHQKVLSCGEYLMWGICIPRFYDLILFFRRIHLPGQYYELNVHFGVFVGGMGNFTEIFFGNQENFRGCLESVYFNGVDVLTKAKVRKIKSLSVKKYLFKILSQSNTNIYVIFDFAYRKLKCRVLVQ